MESSSDYADGDRSVSSLSGPMSQISGIRRLQQSNSIVGIVPKYGVELTDEQPLAQVTVCNVLV
jgi:hypothetical protein